MANELKPTVPELLEKLAAHGDKYHIAAFLEEQGIKGSLGSQDRCAVAQYVTRETGKVAMVSGRNVEWVELTPHPESSLCDRIDVHTVPTPPEVVTFIRAFDNGLFPDLCDGTAAF